MSAEKFCGTTCVTASMDDLNFAPDHKVKVGEVVTLVSQVNRAFNTSMEGSPMHGEHVLTQNKLVLRYLPRIFCWGTRGQYVAPTFPSYPKRKLHYRLFCQTRKKTKEGW